MAARKQAWAEKNADKGVNVKAGTQRLGRFKLGCGRKEMSCRINIVVGHLLAEGLAPDFWFRLIRDIKS